MSSKTDTSTHAQVADQPETKLHTPHRESSINIQNPDSSQQSHNPQSNMNVSLTSSMSNPFQSNLPILPPLRFSFNKNDDDLESEIQSNSTGPSNPNFFQQIDDLRNELGDITTSTDLANNGGISNMNLTNSMSSLRDSIPLGSSGNAFNTFQPFLTTSSNQIERLIKKEDQDMNSQNMSNVSSGNLTASSSGMNFLNLSASDLNKSMNIFNMGPNSGRNIPNYNPLSNISLNGSFGEFLLSNSTNGSGIIPNDLLFSSSSTFPYPNQENPNDGNVVVNIPQDKPISPEIQPNDAQMGIHTQISPRSQPTQQNITQMQQNMSNMPNMVQNMQNQSLISQNQQNITQIQQPHPEAMMQTTDYPIMLEVKHKPRNHKGVWFAIRTGERIRVDKRKGKLVELVLRYVNDPGQNRGGVRHTVQAQQSQDTKPTLFFENLMTGTCVGMTPERIDGPSPKFASESTPKDVIPFPEFSQWMEYRIRVRLTATSRRQCFRASMFLSGRVVTCRSVEFSSDDNGRPFEFSPSNPNQGPKASIKKNTAPSMMTKMHEFTSDSFMKKANASKSKRSIGRPHNTPVVPTPSPFRNNMPQTSHNFNASNANFTPTFNMMNMDFFLPDQRFGQEMLNMNMMTQQQMIQQQNQHLQQHVQGNFMQFDPNVNQTMGLMSSQQNLIDFQQRMNQQPNIKTEYSL